MKNSQIIVIVLNVLIILGIGISLGLVIYNAYATGLNQQFMISVYGCHDGCSIATKQNGWLTNATFDCWDKCDKYVYEILGDSEEKGK